MIRPINNVLSLWRRRRGGVNSSYLGSGSSKSLFHLARQQTEDTARLNKPYQIASFGKTRLDLFTLRR